MDILTQVQQALQLAFAGLFRCIQDVWQWCLNQILAVPWDKVGDLPGSKVLLLVASAGLVAYFLFRAGRELFAAGEKAFAAFLMLLRVAMKTVPPILIAGLAAAAGAWFVNHVQP
jgi:ribose/xylose/arabinose/galactoside ABC-type transport system permease subunit